MAPATASQVVSLGVSRGQFLGEARETGRFEHGRLDRAARPQGGRAGPGQLGRGPGRRRGRASPPPRQSGGAGAVAAHRRRPPHQRVGLRLGQAGQGRSSAPTRSTPSWATACPPSWCWACPGPPSTRPAPRRVLRHAGRRPARGAARPLPPPARVRASPATTQLIEIAPDPDRAQRPGRRRTLRIRPGDAAARGPGPHRRRRRRRRARHPPRGRRRRRRGAARRGPRPAGRASRRRGRRHRGRPALLRRVGRGGGRGACARWPPRCPRRPSCPPCAAATCSARSTWAWPPASCPGRVSLDAGRAALHRRLGLGPRRRRPLDRRHPGLHGGRARRPARTVAGRRRARSSCSAPTRSTTSPTAPWPRRRCRPGTSSWPSRATRPSRSTRTPTSCCPARWRTSARARRPTSRDGSAASAPSSRRPASPGPTG